MGNNGNKIEKVKLTVKEKAVKAGHWAKDHWVQLTLGALALGGGAYLYAKHKGQSEENEDEFHLVYDDPEPDSDEIRDTVQEAWDACDHDPYTGPTDD